MARAPQNRLRQTATSAATAARRSTAQPAPTSRHALVTRAQTQQRHQQRTDRGRRTAAARCATERRPGGCSRSRTVAGRALTPIALSSRADRATHPSHAGEGCENDLEAAGTIDDDRQKLEQHPQVPALFV